jgi:hypothetical protein
MAFYDLTTSSWNLYYDINTDLSAMSGWCYYYVSYSLNLLKISYFAKLSNNVENYIEFSNI